MEVYSDELKTAVELAADHVAPLLRDLEDDKSELSVTFTTGYGCVRVEIFRDRRLIASILDYNDEVEE